MPLEPHAVDGGAEVAVSARAAAGRAQAHAPGRDEELLADKIRGRTLLLPLPPPQLFSHARQPIGAGDVVRISLLWGGVAAQNT